MDSNYWSRTGPRLGRRTLLRGALVAGAGLGAAALVGCGSEEEAGSPASSPSPGSSNEGTAAPTGGGTTSAANPNAPASALIPHVEGEPQYGGSFIEPVTATNAQHDMHTALGRTVWHAISERAFEFEAWTQELRGQAVEEWEIVDDQGLELLMHVRPGLAMHDKEPWNGRDFNAEDLAWNLERNAGNYVESEGIPLTSFQRRSMVQGLQSAEAVDERTVRITMEQPNGAIFNGLSEIRTVLMPKESSEIGYSDPTAFGGFGAYQMQEFRQGEREIFTRHDNYYRDGQPYFDTLERVVVPDRAATLAAFIDGQVSVASGLQPHERDTALQVNRDAHYYEWVSINWNHLRWNTANPALADARVRQAFWLATDRQEINDAYYGPGWGWAATAIPHFAEAWDEDKLQTLPGYSAETRDADRAEAARLLEAAGYANGAGIELVIVPTVNPPHEENALRFMDQMVSLFPEIHLEIQRPSDSAAFATRQAARDFEAIAYVITATPDIFLEWHSQYHTDGSRNYGGFEAPGANEIIERGLLALTQEERLAAAEEFQTKFTTEWFANLIFIATPERYLIQSNIGGFDYNAGPWGGASYRMNTEAGRYYTV